MTAALDEAPDLTDEENNMNGTINQALNDQIQMELESSYLYLALSAYYDSKDLPGFSRTG